MQKSYSEWQWKNIIFERQNHELTAQLSDKSKPFHFPWNNIKEEVRDKWRSGKHFHVTFWINCRAAVRWINLNLISHEGNSYKNSHHLLIVWMKANQKWIRAIKLENCVSHQKQMRMTGETSGVIKISYLACDCSEMSSRNLRVATSRAALEESPPPIGTLVLITASKPGTRKP